MGKYGKQSREKVEQEKVGSGTGFWRPQDGDNRIRIMPPAGSDADFYFRTGTHFNVGPDERAVACPDESGVRDTCFLCRLAKRLKKGDEEERDEGEAIGCRPAYLMSIVDLNSPQDGVQIWRCGITAFKAIKKLWLNDDEYGDMTDLEDGYDIIITKEGSGINTKYDVTPARQNSRFPSKKLLEHSSKAVADLYQSIADEEYDLPDLAAVQTYEDDEEQEAIYKGTAGRKERTEDEDKSSRRSRDDDDDEKPRSRRSRDDNEDEEKPRRSREDDGENDDNKGEDEEKPRSRRSREDDDGKSEGEEKPRRSRSRDDDGEKSPSSRLRAGTRGLD